MIAPTRYGGVGGGGIAFAGNGTLEIVGSEMPGLRNITGRVNGDGTVTIWGVTSPNGQRGEPASAFQAGGPRSGSQGRKRTREPRNEFLEPVRGGPHPEAAQL